MSKSCGKLRRITAVEPRSTDLTTKAAGAPQSPVRRIPQQAESDEQLISLWLHGRSKHTIKGYTNDIKLFFQYINKSLQTTTLQDLQDYADSLATKDYAQTTIKRMLCAVKSLFSFGHRIGYLVFDVGKPLRIPTPKETISERILSQDEVFYVLVQRESDKPVSQLRDFSCLRQIQNPPLAGLFLSGFLRHHKAPNYQKNS